MHKYMRTDAAIPSNNTSIDNNEASSSNVDVALLSVEARKSIEVNNYPAQANLEREGTCCVQIPVSTALHIT